MKLEPIDTRTTAGKIEVMRLASDGRRVAIRYRKDKFGDEDMQEIFREPKWNWAESDYAIIAEPVGPEEVWLVAPKNDGERYEAVMNQGSANFALCKGHVVVRYVRADD